MWCDGEEVRNYATTYDSDFLTKIRLWGNSTVEEKRPILETTTKGSKRQASTSLRLTWLSKGMIIGVALVLDMYYKKPPASSNLPKLLSLRLVEKGGGRGSSSWAHPWPTTCHWNQVNCSIHTFRLSFCPLFWRPVKAGGLQCIEFWRKKMWVFGKVQFKTKDSHIK